MAESTCSVDGCTRPALCRSWCSVHYDRWRRSGKLDLPTVGQRFWAKVDRDSGVTPEHRPELGTCWLWTAYALSTRYGKFTYRIGAKARCVLAHRFAYELEIGPIADSMEIDHLCRSRNCVRPSHLESVTGIENNLRSNSATATNARKTHCIRGHAFNETNTRITRDGWRACRRCRALYRAGSGRLVSE